MFLRNLVFVGVLCECSSGEYYAIRCVVSVCMFLNVVEKFLLRKNLFQAFRFEGRKDRMELDMVVLLWKRKR